MPQTNSAVPVSNEEYDFDKDMESGNEEGSVEEGQDAAMGPSISDNMEINTVHVLSLEFQSEGSPTKFFF